MLSKLRGWINGYLDRMSIDDNTFEMAAAQYEATGGSPIGGMDWHLCEAVEWALPKGPTAGLHSLKEAYHSGEYEVSHFDYVRIRGIVSGWARAEQQVVVPVSVNLEAQAA